MDDVVIHEVSEGLEWRSLTHSLTHSIFINLFIKPRLNIFSPTSPAEYRFCPQGILRTFLTGFRGY